jgi:hypothetical protein
MVIGLVVLTLLVIASSGYAVARLWRERTRVRTLLEA